MSQIQTLIQNIDDLSDTVISIGEKINKLSVTKPPPLTFSDFNGTGMFKFMTNRQIAKRLIMFGGSISGYNPSALVYAGLNATTGPQGAAFAEGTFGKYINKIDEDTAHLIVYGKFLYDANGRLIDNEILYPDCYYKKGEGGEVNNMDDDFPLMQSVKDMKKDLKLAVAGLRIKIGEIGQAFIDMQIQLVLAVTTLASAVTIMPPGSGLPTALSAIKAIPAALMAFQTRIFQILQLLPPLKYLNILIGDKADSAIGSVNMMLVLMKRPFDAIDTVLSLITALAGSIQPVPGVDGEPTEPIVVAPSATMTTVKSGDMVEISANASKGSWQYLYEWTAQIQNKTSGVLSKEKTLKTKTIYTTKYIVKVTDKKEGTVKFGDITINVI
jgi:hypothetical protein